MCHRSNGCTDRLCAPSCCLVLGELLAIWQPSLEVWKSDVCMLLVGCKMRYCQTQSRQLQLLSSKGTTGTQPSARTTHHSGRGTRAHIGQAAEGGLSLDGSDVLRRNLRGQASLWFHLNEVSRRLASVSPALYSIYGYILLNIQLYFGWYMHAAIYTVHLYSSHDLHHPLGSHRHRRHTSAVSYTKGGTS